MPSVINPENVCDIDSMESLVENLSDTYGFDLSDSDKFNLPQECYFFEISVDTTSVQDFMQYDSTNQ